MLKSIYLENFKKFQNNTIELMPFSVLMGENSSGKTSIMQAINLAMNIFSQQELITTENNNIKIREKGIVFPSLPGIDISDNRELFYAKNHKGGYTRGSKGVSIDLYDDKSNIYRLKITSQFGNYNVKCMSTNEDLQFNPTLQSKSVLFISGFVGLNISEERLYSRVIQKRMISGHVSTIIRNLLIDITKESPANFVLLKKRLKNDFDFILDDNLQFDEKKDLYVTAHYLDTVGKNSISLDFNSSGSGFMQILQILTPIYLYCPREVTTVLLDEPDAHLHPNLQTALARSLREIQKELDIQIIISTHSTSIIRASDPSEVIPISSSEKISKPLPTQFDLEQQINIRIDTFDIGKSIISGNLLFIEDEKIDILERFDRICETKCFSGVNTVPYISGKGKDDKVPYSMNEIFHTILKTDVSIHVLRDRDGLKNELALEIQEFAKKANVNLSFLDRYEIENYLLDEKLIFRALQKSNPTKEIPTELQIKAKIVEFLKKTIVYAEFGYINNLEENLYKTSILIGKDEFRNYANCKTEARRIFDQYSKQETYDELIITGMGKESLKLLNHWINNDQKLKLSHVDLLNSIEKENIPKEISDFLHQIKSKNKTLEPTGLPLISVDSDED